MFDVDQIEKLMIAQATAAARRAAEFAVGRAKHHAPVRALFRRDRRGEPLPMSMKTIRSASRYRAFRRSKEKRRRIDIDKAPASESGLVETLSQQTGGVGRTRADGSQTGRRTSANTFTGHSNSFFPVLRQGRYKLTGDIRRFDPKGGGLAYGGGLSQGPERPNPKFGATIKTLEGELPSKEPRYLRDKVVAVPRRNVARAAESRLSSRGRYEVRRATFGGKNNAFHKGRLGGRLRDEIRLEGPERHSGTIWFYVVSPTEYAEYQEFGTGRHRSQPFLRPALYESRSVLRSEVQAAMKDIQNRGLKAGTAMAALESEPGAQDEGR